MALQNIGASNSDDAFYRYKMPKMITKIEGRGNGIKTNIVNMVDIAKALARPASYTTKYFGYELGAQSKFDEKTGTSLVNGAHETSKLAGLLENFIKKYVQCYGCGNPETEIVITKTEMLTLKCAACGFLSDVDMRDKLTSFVLKNPVESKKGSKDKKAMRRAEKERIKEGEAADEEQKKVKKVVKKKIPAAAPSKKGNNAKKGSSDEDRHSNGDHEVDDDDDEDDVEWQTDTSVTAAQKRIQEQLSAVTAEMVMLSTTTEEEKAKKNNHYDALVSDIKSLLAKGSAPSQLKSFFGSGANTSTTPQEKMVALFEALFEGVGKGFAKEVEKKKNYISAAAATANVDGEGEGSLQVILLRAVELFCGKSNGDALKEAGLALKVLYDADLVEEEVIVKWYEEGSKGDNSGSRIWKNVKPFVEWLQNAESESEGE